MHNCILILCLITGSFADLKTPKNSGIIVNPFYDPTDDSNDIKKDPNQVLPPSHKQLAETFNLRNLISNAVRSNTYAVGGDASRVTNPKKPLFSWLSNFLGSGKELTSTNVDADDVLGSTKVINESGNIHANIPDHLNNETKTEIIANLIDSIIVSRLEKKPFTISQKKVQREQLQLISIEEDTTFPHGHNIRSWITIETRGSDKNGLVGISDSSLVLIANRNGAYEIVEELDLKTTILRFTNYQHWNHTSKSSRGIIVVEIANQLIFISTGDDLSGLNIIWQWTIHNRLDSLFYFKHESSDMMLMINAPFADSDEVSADIYKFELESRHTWLVQKIPLNVSCTSVAVINTYKDLILVFVQNNTVELYKSDQHADSKAFKYFSSIEANNVQTVSGFQMGGYSYLATSGNEPKIFRYHLGSFVPQTVLSRRWGIVEVIYPIPARTYRDDLILLVQHRIMMGTHTVAVVEALIWNGESFDVSLSVPCRMGDEIMDFGMTCLLDYERDTGINGLSIIQDGHNISIIVPRVEAPSSLFRLKFELKSFDSPSSAVVEDFEFMSKHIEATTSYQNDIMSQGTDSLTRGLSSNGNDVNAMWNLPTVTADNMILNDGAMWKIDEIYFGNETWSEGDLNFNVDELMRTLQQLKKDVDQLDNIVQLGHESRVQNILPSQVNGKFDMKSVRVYKNGSRPKRSGKSDRQMKFDKLNVKNIRVDYINDVPIDDIIFIQNGVLNTVNSLIVDDYMNVLDEVESENMETVGDGLPDDNHLLDKLPKLPKKNQNIRIVGDLTVDSINGVLWEDFIHQIVMRNLPNLIKKLVVNGNIVAKGNIEVASLNQLSFPRDFLWVHDSDVSIITGEKIFNGRLTVESVDTSGTVDGILTQETISLDEQQHIRGLTTFTQLEVTEILDVNGKVNGQHLNDFKPNLSLKESNIILADCSFQNLHVQGPIFITKSCNGVILDDLLSDVVYKNSPKSIISSFKTFESVQSIVDLTSDLINDIHVGNYMTADTPQDIFFDQFVGNVIIKQLYTDGLFDFINVTELDRNSIKLTGEQFTGAELIFENSEDIDIDANIIEIQKFNGLTSNNLIRVDESLEINGNVIVNTVLVNDLAVGGEINGNGVINGINLNDFDLIRFSRTRAQDIIAEFHIENVVIENEIDSTFVNGIDISDLEKHVNHITNLAAFLSSADVKINNLVIDGNILVDRINGHNFNSIRDSAILLNQPNIINGELQFLDKFEIGQGIIVNNVNDEILENFISGLVLKTDENVEFTGRKIFRNEFHVERDIQANTLNGIATSNIWTKRSTSRISQVNVIGNLFVENVNLQGFLNSVHWLEIEDKYQFNAERGAHILKNNALFTGSVNINDLYIRYGLNSVENVSEFLSYIIRKNHAEVITGKKIFHSNVVFFNHLQAAEMDTVNIPSFLDNIIINDVNQKIIIFGDVAFESDVTASHIHVTETILAGTAMDCSFSEWNENSFSINSPVKIFQPLIFPAGTLQTTNIELEFLNGNSMANIFTLNTEQVFGHLLLSELASISSINVGGLVNSYNMKDIVDNAVLVTGDNHITAPTTLQYARVLSILETVDTINGKDLNKVATLYEDLHLTGPFSFRSIKARNLNTKDTISGINFDYWYNNALWKSQRENQVVSGVWTVSEGIFRSSVKGSTINGILIENLAGQINAQQSNVLKNLEIFNQGYAENCHKMQYLIEKTQTLPFFLTHFEESFSLRFQSVLNSAHFFEANRQNYLLINLGCLTVFHIWNRNIGNYEKLFETETGNVDSWLDMLDETGVIHLVSNTKTDRSNCPTSGLNVWKFDGSSLAHVSKIKDVNEFSLLHSSKLHPQQFLAMTKDDGVIKAFDLQNKLVEQWHLPMSDQQFRFVPENANLGIALSNGKQMSSLSYAKSAIAMDKRKERSTGSLLEAMNDFMDLKRTVRCPFLDEKLENATHNCKLWHQAQLKAMSNIGPYRDLDAITQNRLLKDMSNIQLGLSPFKPKIIPSERGPSPSSNILHAPASNSIATSATMGNRLGNDKTTGDSTARDAFGDVEKVVIDLTDKVVDSVIELDAMEENVDFDDSSVGSSSKDGNKVIGPTSNFFKPHFIYTNNSAYNKSPPTVTSTTEKNPMSSTGNRLGDGKTTGDSTARDAFGDIEKAVIDATDKVVDSFIDLDAEMEDVDFDDSSVGSSSKDGNELVKPTSNSVKPHSIYTNKSAYNKNPPTVTSTSDTEPMSSTTGNRLGNDKTTGESTARDAFGDIEKAVIDATDKVVDSFIELDADMEDVDFDDSSVGSSSKDGKEVVQPTSNPIESNLTYTNNSQSSSVRDMFGKIKTTTTKLTDRVIDAIEDFKDKAKESQAKLQNMFTVKSTNNGPSGKVDENFDEKAEKKNLPKIPKVIYTTNDAEVHATQSPSVYGFDETVTDMPPTTASTEDSGTTIEPITYTTNVPKENVGEEEPKISKEIFSEGIATAENSNFPNHPAEEIIGITVGRIGKHLIAVSSLREHTIQGKQDLIRIYEDIIEGNLFQTLVCHRPRSLTVLNIRDETILAFIENDADIQIFVYRGIQGFVKFSSFELPSFVFKLTAIYLPVVDPFECTKFYLAATMKKEIRFIEAKVCGYCGVNAQLRCD